jgi:hypothetical protein
MFAPDQQTTTSQNFPSPFLTGRPGANGGFDPAFGNNNLLANVNNILGFGIGPAALGAQTEGYANNELLQRGVRGNPLERSGSSYIQNILGGGGVSGASNPFLNAQNRGATGNTLSTAGSIIGGQGLDPNTNPYLQQTFNRAADLTRGRLASEFAGSGRDLGASQPARSEELQTLASNIFGGNYQQERNRQANLTGQSLGLGQQNLQNQRGTFGAGQQLGVQQQQGALGAALPFANQDFTNISAILQSSSNPVDNLINRIGAIAPAAGGTATISQPVHSNPLMAGLGGAALGSQLGPMFSGIQWPWQQQQSPTGIGSPNPNGVIS